MDIAGCLPFLIFFMLVAFLGYRGFIKNESLSSRLSRSNRWWIYCGILLALAMVFAILCLRSETTGSTRQLSSEIWKTLAILVVFLCFLAAAHLLLPVEKKWLLPIAFAISLLPMLFYVVFKDLLSVSILIWVLILLTSPAVVALLFMISRT